MKSAQSQRRILSSPLVLFVSLMFFVPGWMNAPRAAEIITPAQVQALLDTARFHRADTFSRGFFEAGLEAYQKALKDSAAGNRTNLTRKRLEEATSYLERAISTAERFAALFPQLIAAYDSARTVEAQSRAEATYSEARRALEKSVQLLEKGDDEAAAQPADEATALFRRAWVESVREEIFGEIRKRYDELAEGDIPNLTPVLFRSLGDALTEAENRIGSPDWQRAEATAEAMELNDRLAHLQYVADWIRKLPEGFAGEEQLILQYEKTISEICRELDLSPRFDQDMTLNVSSIISEIRKIQSDNRYLKGELARRDQQIGELEAKLPKLSSRTDKYLVELESVRRELQARKRFEEKIQSLTSLIPPEEGLALYRVRGDSAEFFIRLSGLHFRSGKATIQPEDTTLLNLTARIVQEFPQSEVSVYGHTDAQGRADLNLRLSQERADQVRNYLIKRGAAVPSHIRAVGLGETQPLASNDTEEGRARNRRVEILIRNLGEENPF